MQNNLSALGLAIVRVSSTSPKGHFGKYGRVAVMITDGEPSASAIDIRLPYVKEIVSVTGKLFDGVTADCALQRGIRSARATAARINERTFRAMSRAHFVA
jgi:hypothetical protein